MWPILSCLLTLATIYFTRLIYKRRNPSCKGNLPPGSLGLPLIGETIAFFAPYTASDLHPFVRKRIDRYGPVFKTSVVGQPFIVSADEVLNHFIFQQEGRLFESWWPRAFKDTFGQQNVGHMHGVMYKYLKSLILSLFGVESLKETLSPEMNLFVRRTLHEWVTKPSVEVKDGTAAMIFSLTAKKLISYEDEQSLNSLRQSFVDFVDGLISFPLDIPGTAHHKCMEGRRNAMKVLREMMHERRKSPQESRKRDFFDRVIDELNKEKSLLTEGIALDLMFVLLFASFETTSLALTLALKYLIDHPQVLEKVTEEQEKILKKREDPNASITWTEYKSMSFTFQVINETLRLANIAPGIFRKALQDIEIKGYTIPAGWPIMVCPPAVHLNPATYEDPLKFDPGRWEGLDTNGESKNFMGMRFCVGADFSKLQMCIFLHHLVTKYRWEAVKGGETERRPGLAFPNGFHIRLLEKHESREKWISYELRT